jgi:tetratricopeptide (TPR) repeat protein
MGGKRSGTRQYLYFCVAGLIVVMLAACLPARTMPVAEESRDHLQHVQHLLGQGDFEGALQEAHRVLDLSPENPPGDAALFNLGLIHAHHANPNRDYEKALSFFARLEKAFPESPRTAEAKVWAGLIRAGVIKAVEKKEEQESGTHQHLAQLERVQQLIGKGDFRGALRENQQVLSLSPKRPPGDTALFNMGLIYVHYANPQKDIGKALSYFAQLAKDFPGSPRSEEAKIWAGVLETMEKSKQIDIEIEERKKELRR